MYSDEILPLSKILKSGLVGISIRRIGILSGDRISYYTSLPTLITLESQK